MHMVKDIMTSNLRTIDPDDSIEVAISLMDRHGVSGLPVVDMSGHVVGILTEFDLLGVYWDPATAKNQVYHYMTRDVRKVDEDDEVSAAAELFRMLNVRRLLVMRGDRLVGILSRRDLLRHIQTLRQEHLQAMPRP